MGVEEFFNQAKERFIRDNLMSDDFIAFMENNTKPMAKLMAYYRCANMEIETKFKILNEQFSLNYDRNPIESIKTRIKSMESIVKKTRSRNIPLTYRGTGRKYYRYCRSQGHMFFSKGYLLFGRVSS